MAHPRPWNPDMTTATTPAKPLPDRRPCLLLVDDEPTNLQVLKQILQADYRLLFARDGEKALQLAQQEQPQLILLDVMMPGQDGWALLGQLREHPQTGHIPVIVSTILPQEELALDLGSADFIRKPVSQTVLLSVLERQLARLAPKPC